MHTAAFDAPTNNTYSRILREVEEDLTSGKIGGKYSRADSMSSSGSSRPLTKGFSGASSGSGSLSNSSRTSMSMDCSNMTFEEKMLAFHQKGVECMALLLDNKLENSVNSWKRDE